MTFEELFATSDSRKDNFRSRLFGLFSEDVVRFWARGDAPYRALEGRPTIYEGAGHVTIDFTLERRTDRRLFIAEQKAELAWTGYAYLRLDNAAQVNFVEQDQGRLIADELLEEPSARCGEVSVALGNELVTGRVANLIGKLAPESPGRDLAVPQAAFGVEVGAHDSSDPHGVGLG